MDQFMTVVPEIAELELVRESYASIDHQFIIPYCS
jgi:hypothetical protein